MKCLPAIGGQSVAFGLAPGFVTWEEEFPFSLRGRDRVS